TKAKSPMPFYISVFWSLLPYVVIVILYLAVSKYRENTNNTKHFYEDFFVRIYLKSIHHREDSI
ncbi:hypothetical protein, partial [Bartonella queenslandensis]|uniref:hypothetical protein n=1 Tax=Bartonella queenslandensis TaxID=481138 RepID=UPI001AEC3327